MEDGEIWARTVEGVLWLTIDRPQVGNALSPDNRMELVRENGEYRIISGL